MPAPLIVVVEDHEATRQLFALALEEAGYRVNAYHEETAALASIQHERPDLLILDLWLASGATGWDVCAELARDPATATIPIIMSTAVAPAMREQPASLHPHALAFLDKPFRIPDLLAMVETALAS
jgi:CheY-like chemotaxis protein